ncbi:11260_t:CDS:2 [Paraglomus brasilianum]|uniref:11260_t:CDS:1 n=1 Tax=Paraglomus brasilianum TaxID=144538 RepID=A0A9N9C2T0_9GLOM|nr:11260_t:CDS:2 [Paraglomus brasilianum]
MRIETLVEGKIPVKALIDTSSKFNTISKRLFNKLKSNHGIHPSCGPAECLYGDIIDGMSIPLIEENSNKDSSGKNDQLKSDLSEKEIANMIKKILSDASNSDTSDSNSGNSSASSSGIEVIHMKRPILKRKVKAKFAVQKIDYAIKLYYVELSWSMTP